MNLVNRISLIITPKEPMYLWIKDTSPDEAPTFEELISESSCYLIEEPTEDAEIDTLTQQLITMHFQAIWRNELGVWDEYLDNAPANLSLTLFNDWFKVSLSGLTFDLAKQPLLIASVD